MTILTTCLVIVWAINGALSYSEDSNEFDYYTQRPIFGFRKTINPLENSKAAVTDVPRHVSSLKLTATGDEKYLVAHTFNDQTCSGSSGDISSFPLNKCVNIPDDNLSFKQPIMAESSTSVSIEYAEFEGLDCAGSPVSTSCKKYFCFQSQNLTLGDCSSGMKYELSSVYPLLPKGNSKRKYYYYADYLDSSCNESSLDYMVVETYEECIGMVSDDGRQFSFIQTVTPGWNPDEYQIQYQEFTSVDCTGVGQGQNSGYGDVSSTVSSSTRFGKCITPDPMRGPCRSSLYCTQLLLDAPPHDPVGHSWHGVYTNKNDCESAGTPFEKIYIPDCMFHSSDNFWSSVRCDDNSSISEMYFSDNRCQIPYKNGTYDASYGHQCDSRGLAFDYLSTCPMRPVAEPSQNVCLSDICIDHANYSRALLFYEGGCNDKLKGDELLVVKAVSILELNPGNYSLLVDVKITVPPASDLVMHVAVVARVKNHMRAVLNTAREFTIPKNASSMHLSLTSPIKDISPESHLSLKFKHLGNKHGCGKFHL